VQVPTADPGPPQGLGERACGAAKRAYHEAFGLVEPAAPCALLGGAPTAKRCETMKWNLPLGADKPARAAPPHPATCRPAAFIATSAASGRWIAPSAGPVASQFSPAALELELASLSADAANSTRSAASLHAQPVLAATLDAAVE